MRGRLKSRFAPASPLELSTDPATGLATDASHLTTSSFGTYLRRIRRREATGVGATDIANIASDLAAMAGVGELTLYGGTFIVSPRAGDGFGIEVPSKVRVFGHPNVTLASTLVANGNPRRAIFWCEKGAVGTQTTLSANVAAGAESVTTAASIPAGSIVRFNSVVKLFHAATRVVLSVSGAGPYTLVLDEPLLESFASGDGVSVLASVPTDIEMDGAGWLMTGSGERCIEFADALRCRVANMNTASISMIGNIFAFDVGGRHNKFDGINADAGASAIVGIALESNDNSTITRCRAQHATQVAIGLYDCNHCLVDDSKALDSVTGISALADGSLYGCTNVTFRDSWAFNCTTNGFSVLTGAVGTRIENGGARGCQNGLLVAGDGSSTPGTVVTGARFTESTQYGVWNGTGSAGLQLHGVDATASASSALHSQDDIEIDGFESRSGGSSGVVRVLAGVAKMRGLRLTYSGAATYLVNCDAGTNVTVSDSVLTMSGAGNNCVAFQGIGTIRDSKLTSANFGIVSIGTTFESNCDLSGCTTPRYYSSGSHIVDGYSAATPEAAIVAGIGSTWRNTAGGAGTSFYVKQTGTGNTGWVGK